MIGVDFDDIDRDLDQMAEPEDKTVEMHKAAASSSSSEGEEETKLEKNE